MSDRAEVRVDGVKMQWGVQIPMRDGLHLSATLYLPSTQDKPSPVILSLTPYVAQSLHEYGLYFASHGYPFAAVDVRGRGNSEGEFRPFVHDGKDGHDVVEWLAHQPYCNGQVATWGGSYGGFTQWALAKEFPPHLATIAPTASVHPGVDFPIYCNIVKPYIMRWLTFVAGHALQDKIFGDLPYWSRRFKEWFESGVPFNSLDRFLGHPSATFQEWVQHPEQDSHWQQYNPTSEQYAKLAVPILTITGQYDGDQPGALTHYRQHRMHATSARHCLVIGPWDHPGTRDPKAEFGGMKMGPNSLVDLGKLHLQWYAWTMQGGARPEFLRKDIAYYVIGADEWRYADSLEQITARSQPLYLQSNCNPTDVFASGVLHRESSSGREFDRYIYDPRDVSLAALESAVDPNNAMDQRMVHARRGKQLIYHSAPFEKDAEICGFFKLQLWIAIDRPDTDFRASVYEIGLDGSSVLLATDSIRARYRESLQEARLIDTQEPLRYDFERFMFVARQIKARHRLRLVVGPVHSIYSQRNCNTGRPVAEESLTDAQPVTVTLFHDESHPSVLYIPLGSG